MLIVSCRKDFDHDYECANNQIADIDLTDHAEKVDPADILGSVEDRLNSFKPKQKVLLLIHGYNNTFGQVKDAYKVIRDNHQKWTRFHDIIIGFTWPGGKEWFDYEERNESVSRKNSCVVYQFADLLKKLAASRAVESVDTLSHSLGCRISLAAYTKLHKSKKLRKKLKKSHRQFLTAADVNVKSIMKNQRYFHGSDVTKSCHVFYSNQDEVLSPLVRGSVESDSALGSRGPKGVENISTNIYGVNCLNVLPFEPDNSRIVHRRVHSRYKYTKEVYEYIKEIVDNQSVERWKHFQQQIFPDTGGS